MGEAFITRRGGGGGPAGLNFEVVGGTTQPKNPKENTIWINTAREITRWDFSAEHPYLVSKTKNFICHPFYDPTATMNGVAYTDNGDGTVKANGTATSDATFRLSFINAADKAIYLPAGKYFLSGCPAGGSSDGYRVEAKNVSTGETLVADYGAGAAFVLSVPTVVRCNIVVANGTTVSNVTFNPQLEKGSSKTAFVKGDATGQVWITAGTSSTVEFNALKKNGIQVYPVSAKQYVSGAWVDREAKIYQNGAWADWAFLLLNKGVFASGYEFGIYQGSGAISYPTGCVRIKINNNHYLSSFSPQKVDITNFKTAEITVAGGKSKYPIHIGLTAEKSTPEVEEENIFEVASVAVTRSGYNVPSGAQSIDLSAVNGTFWFGCTIAGTLELDDDNYGCGGLDIVDIVFK